MRLVLLCVGAPLSDKTKVVLNHKTYQFRLLRNGQTVARVEEVETRDGMIHGYNYADVKPFQRILVTSVPA